jgi:hypothetical protein
MSQVNAFANHQPGLDSPASRGFTITPSDTTPFTEPCRAIYVGGAGDVTWVGLDGVACTFVGVAAGSILPVRAMRVNATGTTATNLRGLI